MIAGDDEQAMAEAAAAATSTAITADDDPELIKYFEKYGGRDKKPLDEETPDEASNRILKLESQAAVITQLANQFAQAADNMRANFINKDGDITQEDLDKMRAYATAGGFRSQAFLNSPPEVQAAVDKFESLKNPVNVAQGLALTKEGFAAALPGGDMKEFNKTLYQMEIKRSRMMARTLGIISQRMQDQANSLSKKSVGSAQPSPTSTEPE